MARMSRDYIEYGLNWRWRPERLLDCCKAVDHTVLGAYKDERPVAFTAMQFGEQDAHLLLMAVMPRYRRGGVARAMLAWLEAAMRTMGLARIFVELRVQNTGALAFYQRAGFHIITQIPGYYDGREDAYRMMRELSADFTQGQSFYGLPDTSLASWLADPDRKPPADREKP